MNELELNRPNMLRAYIGDVGNLREHGPGQIFLQYSVTLRTL